MSSLTSRLRLALWGLVGVAAVAATLLFFVTRPAPDSGGIGGGSYALVDQRGNPVDQSMLVGQPSLLFFGYTHCPDVCPTTMGEMAGWFADLGDEAKTLKAFFVTVDPERDTPEILDGYVSWVSDRVTGVTGKPEEIAKMVKAWKVLGEKVPGQGSDYTMNHTASVFLVNAQGGFEGTIAYEEATPVALGKIRKLLGKSA
ncbi:SCO family protein [Devosia sp.]|uniref:SCO family protein n=1 Tax=Devosia sp. TaxID=1871048 RepID=UPI003F71E851